MKISLTKQNEFKFRLNLQGANEMPEARLVLKFGAYSIMSEGFVSNNIVKVKLPDMSFLRNEGLTAAVGELEVLVNGQYKVPWRETLDIEQEVTVEAAMMDSPLQEEAVDQEIELTAVIESVENNYKAKEVVFPRIGDK